MYMHVTALHHIGLLLLLNVYGYITDKSAFRQTKLATLVGLLTLAWYDTYYLRAPSQPVFAGLTTCDRPVDHATPSVTIGRIYVTILRCDLAT